jgi:hypothetical protein
MVKIAQSFPIVYIPNDFGESFDWLMNFHGFCESFQHMLDFYIIWSGGGDRIGGVELHI